MRDRAAPRSYNQEITDALAARRGNAARRRSRRMFDDVFEEMPLAPARADGEWLMAQAAHQEPAPPR